MMKIGIIGAGNVGIGLGRRLAAHGHDIVASFTRTPQELTSAVAAIGGGARGGEVADAARHGDVVILATPWAITLEVVRAHADILAGRIVWDTTNPLLADLSGLAVGTTSSGGEEIAAAAPGVRIVKAVVPFAELLNSSSTRIGGQRPGVFVCGDDAAARAVIVQLVDEIDADAVDAGPLRLARYTEPLGMLLVQLAYVQGFGAHIGSVLIRDPPPIVPPPTSP